MKNNVQVIQRWGRSYDRNIKNGKEYWVRIKGNIWVCRKGKRLSIGHRCNDNTLHLREIRKSRGTDSHTYCCSCKWQGPSRKEIEEMANKKIPDLATLKFLAQLDGLNGRNTRTEC